jgi:hypothetical protein
MMLLSLLVPLQAVRMKASDSESRHKWTMNGLREYIRGVASIRLVPEISWTNFTARKEKDWRGYASHKKSFHKA